MPRKKTYLEVGVPYTFTLALTAQNSSGALWEASVFDPAQDVRIEIGKIFFVDSAQEGEVPYERVLEGFTVIAHEPYYMDYTQNEIGDLFSEAGFEVDAKEVHWVSKLLVATKPGGGVETPSLEEV